MSCKIYYSPFGGEIFACFEEGQDDDLYRLKALFGDAKVLEVAREHPVMAHVRSAEPTDLRRWLVRDGQLVPRELFAAAVGVPEQVTAARADAAAARAESAAVRTEIAALRRLIEERLVLPGPPGGGG